MKVRTFSTVQYKECTVPRYCYFPAPERTYCVTGEFSVSSNLGLPLMTGCCE